MRDLEHEADPAHPCSCFLVLAFAFLYCELTSYHSALAGRVIEPLAPLLNQAS